MDTEADKFVPFNGGQVRTMGKEGLGGNVLSHEETVKKWISFNGGIRETKTWEIPSAAESSIGNRQVGLPKPAFITAYFTSSGATVESVVICNAGHTWPGHITQGMRGTDGITPMNFDASKLICEFFQHI